MVKGDALEYYKKDDDREVLTKNTVDTLIGEFHYYLSDYRNKYSSSTASHITDIINILFTKNIITQYVNTIWEENGWCTNHYRCATAYSLLSIIAVVFNMIVYCDLGVLEHVKDFVDSLNAVGNQYLKK